MSFDRVRQQRDLGPRAFEPLLRALLDESVHAVAADRGTLYLLDPSTQTLASHIADLPEVSQIHLQVGEGIAGWVAQHRRVARLPTHHRDPRWTRRVDQATGYVTRSLLAAPMLSPQGDLIGVLQVLNKRKGEFNPRDESRLSELATEAAALLADTTLGPHWRQQRPLTLGFDGIVGTHPSVQEIHRRLLRAAPTEASVLILGESGVGKELYARALHVNSPRAQGPLVVVDCAAVAASLIENELFGHARGAYTGADRDAEGRVHAARGGTLYLDEIGDLPLAVQGKLLRLIQERTFQRLGSTREESTDVRFVCATHHDLDRAVAEGRFRRDLYHRLRVVPLHVPPLRERGEADLDLLVEHFLGRFRTTYGRPGLALGPGCRERLLAHRWPGNIRELQHVLEAAAVLAPSDTLRPADLEVGLAPEAGAEPSRQDNSPTIAAGARTARGAEDLEGAMRAHAEAVLRANRDNWSEAARRLGISRNRLKRLLGALR